MSELPLCLLRSSVSHFLLYNDTVVVSSLVGDDPRLDDCVPWLPSGSTHLSPAGHDSSDLLVDVSVRRDVPPTRPNLTEYEDVRFLPVLLTPPRPAFVPPGSSDRELPTSPPLPLRPDRDGMHRISFVLRRPKSLFDLWSLLPPHSHRQRYILTRRARGQRVKREDSKRSSHRVSPQGPDRRGRVDPLTIVTSKSPGVVWVPESSTPPRTVTNSSGGPVRVWTTYYS